MDNQRIINLWMNLKTCIWKRIVQIGRKNAVLRVGILAVVAVGLFLRHLRRYVLATPSRRFVSVCCAAMLVLSDIHFPLYVWATEQEENSDEAGWISDEVDGDDVQWLRFEVKKSAPIVEGYGEAIQYQLKIVNPENGTDLSGIKVRADMADVYLVTYNEGTGKNEEVRIFCLADAPSEESSAVGTEPETESEEPSTETESEEPSTETESEEPSEEPSTEIGSEEPSTETGSEEPGEEPSTEVGNEEPGEEPSTEIGNEESGEEPSTENGGEEPAAGTRMAAAPDSLDLPAGKTICLRGYIATGLPAGEYVETLKIQALGLDRPIIKKLSVVVSAPSEEEQETSSQDEAGTEDPSAGGSETPSEPEQGVSQEPSAGGSETPSEPEQGVNQEPSTGGSETPLEPEQGVSQDETGTEYPGVDGSEMPSEPEQGAEDFLQGEEDSEGEPIEEDPFEEEPSEENDQGYNKEESEPTLVVLSREGGVYSGKTFFAVTDTMLELAVEPGVAAVFSEIDGETEELAVEDGRVMYYVPEQYNGILRFYTVDEDGNVSGELLEYVVTEKTAPVLAYMNVISSTDSEERIRITIEDCGDIISGLDEIRCEVDGEPYVDYKADVFDTTVLCSGEEVISGLSLDVPLSDMEIHTIEVYASDNAGNVLERSFRVHSSQRDIVSVVLPTSVGMAMFPYSSNGNVWGDDIVIANQGDFSIEVSLKSVQIGIDHNTSGSGESNVVKDAELSLNLLLSEDRKTTIKLAEGYNKPGVCFVLGPKNPETDAVALQKDRGEKKVASEDYAIVNVRGVFSKGSGSMWKSGDITVALTFTFKRLEEPEEEDGDL